MSRKSKNKLLVKIYHFFSILDMCVDSAVQCGLYACYCYEKLTCLDCSVSCLLPKLFFETWDIDFNLCGFVLNSV